MKKLIILIGLITSLSACESMLFETDKASADPYVNFEYLWSELDKKYSYFELKNINWNVVKTKYQAKLSKNMSEEALFKVLADMMNELRDDHSNLSAPFDVSVYNIALRSNANYNQRTIELNYLENKMQTGAFSHAKIKNQNIAYVRYASFMDQVTAFDLDYILNKYATSKGLILDLRENGGGDIFNVPLILERFNNEKRKVGYFKTRNGIRHNDFSQNEAFNIGSYSGTRYDGKLIVLIDRGSYSATTMFAVAAKGIPGITLIGDTTGGGGGAPNGGQLPNGWTYRFSISQILDLEGKAHAEDGVAPHIKVSFNWSNLNKDEIIDKAISVINSL